MDVSYIGEEERDLQWELVTIATESETKGLPVVAFILKRRKFRPLSKKNTD